MSAEITSTADLMPFAAQQQRAAATAAEFWETAAHSVNTAVITTQLIAAGLTEDRAHEEARRFTQAAATLAEQWSAVNRACTQILGAHVDLITAANRTGRKYHTGIRIA